MTSGGALPGMCLQRPAFRPCCRGAGGVPLLPRGHMCRATRWRLAFSHRALLTTVALRIKSPSCVSLPPSFLCPWHWVPVAVRAARCRLHLALVVGTVVVVRNSEKGAG